MDVLKDIIAICVGCGDRFVITKFYQEQLIKMIEEMKKKNPNAAFALPKRCPACLEIKRIRTRQKEKLLQIRSNGSPKKESDPGKV